MPSPNPARIAVLLDYQNVLQRGHWLYGRGKEPYQCVPEPALVADLLARRRRVPSEATSILVFRDRDAAAAQVRVVHPRYATGSARAAGRGPHRQRGT